MLQKLPVNKLEWVEDTSQFHECFMENYIENVVKDIFLKLIFNILKSYLNFIMIYQFYQKE